MRKSHREAEQLLKSLGLTVLGRERGGKHHMIRFSDAAGHEYRHSLPHDMTNPRGWKNWLSDVKKRLVHERS